MNWTRLLAGALVLAGCGDDEGDSRGDTQIITTATMTNPTSATNTMSGSDTSGLTGGLEESGSGTASASSTIEPTTAATTDELTTANPTTPTMPTTTPPDETTSTGTDTGDDTTTQGVKFDMAPLPDVPPPVCLQCALTIASMQSGTFAVGGQAVFATAQLTGQVVYALGTYGGGRFIATADSSLPFNEQTDCPLTEWLAANGGVQPKVLIFGWTPSDGPGAWNVVADKVLDVHLPAQFIGNPALLRQTYDIVMYLESSFQHTTDIPSDQEVETLLDYVDQGGGMYISSEFYGYMNDADLASVNRMLMPLGVTSNPVSLNWGNVDGNIDFECFPEPQ